MAKAPSATRCPRSGSRRNIAAALFSMAGLFGCHSHTTGPTEPPPSVPTVTAISSTTKIPKRIDAGATTIAHEVPLSSADCRALQDAEVLGLAVVSQSDPDCSGVGHRRVVLELHNLARGHDITRVVTSQPLVSSLGPNLEIGDVALVAIEPSTRPAETVFCVPMPAHQGLVRHATKVTSIDEGEAILAALEAGRPCRPEPCPAPSVPALGAPESRPGALPHPGWAEGARAHLEGQDAVARGDRRLAAERFLWCAEVYRHIQTSGPNGAIAEQNALRCYRSAAECFASAGRFASEGHATLERAAQGPSAIAEGVRSILDAPPIDCGVVDAARSR